MTITPSDLRALADAMPAAIDDPETRTAWIASAFDALHRAIAQMQARDAATERVIRYARMILTHNDDSSFSNSVHHAKAEIALRDALATLDAVGAP